MRRDKINPIDAIRAVEQEFQEAMAAEPVEIVEENWQIKGEPFRCYIFPATIDEDTDILAASKRGGQYEEILQTIISRARNRDRSRIFSQLHIQTLRSEGIAETIRRIARQINESDTTPEEAEKNSESPSSSSDSE